MASMIDLDETYLVLPLPPSKPKSWTAKDLMKTLVDYINTHETQSPTVPLPLLLSEQPVEVGKPGDVQYDTRVSGYAV